MNRDERRWILELTFDAVEASVRIVFTLDPERGTWDQEVVVPTVSDFHAERYHEPESIALGDFTGCTITPQGSRWRYEMDTGDAMIRFDAEEKVVL